jgi:aminoglycoside phosphotransferase (APT) family kinase protein
MEQEPTSADRRLDEHRDPADAARVRALAAQVAERCGADPARMRRANGYSNATWVGDGIAVRIAHEQVEMMREAELARALPPAVGHPRILGVGVVEGHGWIVTREVPAQNLGEIWSTLDPSQQSRAIGQLWGRARIVHEATPVLRPHVGASGGFVPAGPAEARTAAERAASVLGLSDLRRGRLREVLESWFRCAPEVEQVVDHGDLALMNALWDDGVVALLDFEYAVLAPVEVDLCRLVGEARVSEEGELVDSEAGAVAAEIAAGCMDPVHGPALLRGAAVLDQLRDLGIWVAQAAAGERAEDWRPARLLDGLLDDAGGFLAGLLR